MEEGKKKLIMIIVIVVFLAAAGIITYLTRSGGTGIDSIKHGEEMYWIKCRNPDCENAWQMDKRDYFDYLNEHRREVAATEVPAIVCPKCGEDSGYRAEKCPSCGFVFERGSVPNDLPDRCPECGYSAIESKGKKAAGKD